MRDEIAKLLCTEIRGWIFEAIINRRTGTPLAEWMGLVEEDIKKRVAVFVEALTKEKKP